MAVSVDNAKCTGCGSCVGDCMVGALSIVDGVAMVNSDLCVECGVCMVDSCPVDAISSPYQEAATTWV